MRLDPSLGRGDSSPGVHSYEELYVEHAPAARRLALSMVASDMADDIVAEAFARVLAAIRSGGGPSQTFRGYLLTAVRNVANDWLRARRRVTVVDDTDVAAGYPAVGYGRINPGLGSAAETQVEARDEARLVTRAFGRLPALARGSVAAGSGGQGPGGGGAGVRLVLQRCFRPGHARAGRASAGLPGGACRCEYPAGVPYVCGRVRRRGACRLSQRRRGGWSRNYLTGDETGGVRATPRAR